ncbi:TetR/AcrR family transcriptional regulator [Phenylobacterium sp.]|uniref:TetR/AcrR family transcriptional regulator n=1 Tax=Phenylobacterium sp. TaxID=1871053 RepID=UPI0035B3F90E
MARPRIGDKRRGEILTAFEACVVRQGLADTTLTDVAIEAGQPRSLVRYFIGNRADMVTALIDRLLERGEAQLRKVEAQGRASTADELSRVLFNEVFADNTTNIVIMELWHLSLRDAELRSRLAAIYLRLVTEVATRVADRFGADGFDRAYAAVTLAFGAAFFAHLGLTPRNPELIRTAGASLLGAKSEPSQEGEP